MKQALKVVAEIKRLKNAEEKTKSDYLRKDYSKAIKRLVAELKEYCGYRQIDFKELMKGGD